MAEDIASPRTGPPPETNSGTAGETDILLELDMARLIADADWSHSPLGPPETWPPSLRNAVGLLLPAAAQIVLFWGPEFVAIYNDAYAPTIGDKHPRALGRPACENWSELWDDLRPLLQSVRDTGRTVVAKDRPFYIERHGYPETVYFDISYSAVTDENGTVAGVLCIVNETTEQVLAHQALRESEERLRLAVDNAEIGFWDVQEGHGELTWPPATKAMFGISPDVPVSMDDFYAGVHPEDLPSVAEAYGAAADPARRALYDVEYRTIGKEDKVVRWVAAKGRGIFDGDGPDARCLRVIGTAIDITSRKSAEEALRESDARLRAALEASEAGTFRWDIRTNELDWDEALDKLFGLAPGITARSLDQFIALVHPEQQAAVIGACERCARSGADFEMEFRVVRPDGTVRWIYDRGKTFLGSDGKPAYMTGACVDITERKQAEEEVHDERRNLEILNRIGSAIAGELDFDRLVQIVTDAATELSGAAYGAFFYNITDEKGERYKLYSLSGADLEQAEKLGMPRITKLFEPTFSGTEIVRCDDVTKDPRYGTNSPNSGMPQGHLEIVSYLAVPVISRTGEVLGGLFFGHPEAGRFKQNHENLVIGIAGQAATAMDNANLYRKAQHEIEQRVRAEQALTALNETLESRVAEEIAHRSRTEEALRHAQKMETVGQLSGGIAHDFNNLLQIIHGNLTLLQRALPAEEDKWQRSVRNALTGTERAAALTQRLLAFSRRQPLDPKPLDVNRMIAEMIELLHRTLGETIAIETRFSDALPSALVDGNQLENAILNLAINARDAMPRGGRLEISTTLAELDAAAAKLQPDASPGRYICITVRDTGEGMSPEVLSRAVEPFFSTKEVGQGTGLGLSMVYGFAKQSGGHLVLQSVEGEGTSVQMFVPASSQAAESRTRPEQVQLPSGKGERILLCEDDKDVRRFSRETLDELGYEVIEAADANSALDALRSIGRIDLLFTDIVLPVGRTGADLARAARELQPDLKVLFATGYARSALEERQDANSGIELLLKPFSVDDLATRLRKILDS
ncbi:MAG TPA: PAS domain-containing protein [Sphingomicrobium sp.]|nr:PAS domain-containing protein [Sphingomicrobium sp.]